jgi:hypothetical protein
MTIKELKNFLIDLGPEHDDDEVVMSSDAEGNNYSPLSDIDDSYSYFPGAPWYGEIKPTDYDKYVEYEGDVDEDKEEWEEYCKGKSCLVLWPVN